MSDAKNKNKQKSAAYTYAVGRRKTAIARIRLYDHSASEKKIDITVNDQPIQTYFRLPQAEDLYLAPLKLTNTLDRYKITVKVEGSGPQSQIDAIVHALSRALIKINPEFRPALKKQGFLTRDPRKKQRRMIGTGGKARRQKQSPKR